MKNENLLFQQCLSKFSKIKNKNDVKNFQKS